jgi:hypothetical protein
MVAVLPVIACAFLAACESSNDGGEVHWFDCKPVLAKLAECGIEISFDGQNIADPEEAYESCEFAHGNMWLHMYKCYKENSSCEDLAQCLPDHGFIPPGEDDTIPDDSASDDTTNAGDDTGSD